MKTMGDSNCKWRIILLEIHANIRAVLRGRFEIGCQACSSSSSALASLRSRVSNPSVDRP
jgi:hypothetical protein